MTGGRPPGYTPFANAPPFQDEETPLPASIPADELSHLNATDETQVARQTDADQPTLLTAVVNFVWQGGSPGDAWLHMTAAQVLHLALLVQLCLYNTSQTLSTCAGQPA